MILPRSENNIDESITTWKIRYYKPERIIYHHTTHGNDYSRKGGILRVSATHRYHTLEGPIGGVPTGWGDGGYNVVIDKYGRVSAFRKGGPGIKGAHTRGRGGKWWNKGSIGIGGMGNFSIEEPSEELVDASVETGYHLCWVFGLDPLAKDKDGMWIVGSHRDFNGGECPGERFYQRMDEIRERIGIRL